MAQNGTNLCAIVDQAQAAKVKVVEDFIEYRLVTSIHFFIGLAGHIILLTAFYKQLKNDSAYFYQIIVTVSETFELIAWALLVLTFKCLSGAQYTYGYLWYKKSYFLMFFAARVTHTCYHGSFTCSLLLSLAMTADRVYGLAYPFQYQAANHTRHRVIVVSVCVLVGFISSSVPEWFLFLIQREDDHYVIAFNPRAGDHTLYRVMGHARNLVRLIGLISLLVLSVTLIHLFRAKYTKVAVLNRSSKSVTDKKRRTQENTLVVLTICQSTFQCAGVLSFGIYTTIVILWPFFANCIRTMVFPITDMIIEICDLLDLFMTIVINKHFRNQVLTMLPFCKPVVELLSSSGAGKNNEQFAAGQPAQLPVRKATVSGERPPPAVSAADQPNKVFSYITSHY